jgi:hypothetical protein
MPNAINRFLELIDTESFHIPFSAQWAVLITLPDGLIGEIKNVPNFEDSRWYPGSDIFTELTKQSVFTDEGVGCIFADSVTQIGDGFGVTDADIGDSGTTGGIIPGIYSKNRTGFASKLLKMKFRETSLSFTDFVIRPWIILASHYGRIADKNNVTKSPEITVINFSKGKSPAQIRKSFKYFQCTPYMVDDIEMTYEKDTVMSYSVTWSFERYAIDEPARSLIGTVIGMQQDAESIRVGELARQRQPRAQGIIKQDSADKRRQLNNRDPLSFGGSSNRDPRFDPLGRFSEDDINNLLKGP